MKPILFALAFFTASLTKAQTLFTQGFNGGTNVANLINFGTTTNGQFNDIGPVYDKACSETFKAGALIVLRDTKKRQLKTRQDKQGKLFLHSSVPDKAQLFIFDVNGRQRATSRLNVTPGENVYTLPVLLERGIYFVKVQTNSGVLIQRFI